VHYLVIVCTRDGGTTVTIAFPLSPRLG
jgi:hypothetical protein